MNEATLERLQAATREVASWPGIEVATVTINWVHSNERDILGETPHHWSVAIQRLEEDGWDLMPVSLASDATLDGAMQRCLQRWEDQCASGELEELRQEHETQEDLHTPAD